MVGHVKILTLGTLASLHINTDLFSMWSILKGTFKMQFWFTNSTQISKGMRKALFLWNDPAVSSHFSIARFEICIRNVASW